MFKMYRKLLPLLAALTLTGHVVAEEKPALLPPPGPYISSQPWLPKPVKPSAFMGAIHPHSPTAMPGSVTPMPQPNATEHAPSMPFPPHQGGWRW